MINKYFSFWLIGFLLLIGSILFFIGGPDYYSNRSLKHFWDFGHILYFALLTILLSRWNFITQNTLLWQWIYILSITLIAGISIELLQHATSRSANIGDVLRDLTGSLLILTFGPLSTELKSLTQKHYLRLTVTTLTLVLLWPLTKSVIDETMARNQFPLLSSFDTPFEIDRWVENKKLSVESIASISHSNILKISLTTDKYSGAALNYFNGNWALARFLKVSLYNPEVTVLQVTFRINDRQHSDGFEEYEDRYNKIFDISPGWNQVEIELNEVENSPANRKMDMKSIRGLGLFTTSLSTTRILYLDKIFLTY